MATAGTVSVPRKKSTRSEPSELTIAEAVVPSE
jgi:hypothetical protein